MRITNSMAKEVHPDSHERAERVAKRLEIPMLIAALLVIPLIIIEQSHPDPMWSQVARYLNWGIWVAFFSELVIMLYVTPNRWHWLKSNPLETAIVLITPPFMPAALQSIRAVRLLRLSRLLRAHKLITKLFTFKGLEYAAFFTAFIVIAGGAAFTIAEKDQDLGILDGLYWALATVSTLGSDISPRTAEGKAISLLVLFVGTGFIAMLTAAFAQRFINQEVAQQKLEDDNAALHAKLDRILESLEKNHKA